MSLPITVLVEQVQNTRIWLFIKGIFLLFLAAMVALNIFSVYVLMVLLAIFAIVGGIVTIIMGFVNKMDHGSYMTFALITGLVSLVLGIVFFIWPAFSTQFWVIFYLLELMLDGLFIASAMLSVKVMGASKWWAIAGGLIVLFLGLIFVFRVAMVDPKALAQIGTLVTTFATPGGAVMDAWNKIGNDLAMYLFVSSIFFFVTVMVISPKNVAKSIANKAEKTVEKTIKKATKTARKTTKKAVKNVKKAVRR